MSYLAIETKVVFSKHRLTLRLISLVCLFSKNRVLRKNILISSKMHKTFSVNFNNSSLCRNFYAKLFLFKFFMRIQRKSIYSSRYCCVKVALSFLLKQQLSTL